MNHDASDSLSPRFAPRLTRLLALAWTATVAIIFWWNYNAGGIRYGSLEFLQGLMPMLHRGPHLGEFWLRRLMDAGWCLGVLVTAFAAGSVLIHRFVREHTLLTGLFALGTGLWVLATAVLIIGIVSATKVGWVFVLAGGWLLPAPRAYFGRSVRQLGDGWTKLMWALILVAAGLCLLGAVTPPFEYDELEYHLGAPSEYLKAGKIVFLPHNFYSNLPQLTEMLYLLGLATRSAIAAKMLHWCFGLLSASAIYAVAGKLWSRRIGITAATLFYCMPFVQDLSQTARIDLATTFFATLAFGGVLLATDGDRWLWLAGMMAGAAVATKWTAIPVVFIPATVGLLLARRSLWSLTVFGFLASIMVLPWLLKNWCFAGNPIYPLWSSSEHWSVAQAELFARKHYATFDSTAFTQFFRQVSQYSFAEIGALPTLLMTAPLCLFIRGNGRLRRAGWLFVVAYVSWFALTFRPWRFLFPVLPVAAALGACALDSVGKWCRGVVVAVWLAGLTLMGFRAGDDMEANRRSPQAGMLNLALGQLTEEEFLTRLGHGVFEPIMWMNDHLPAHAKVLYIGDVRVALARQQVVWATAFDQHPALNKVEGITHVYVNFSEWERLRTNYGYLLDFDNGTFRRWLQEHGRLIHESGRGKVWEVQ